MLFGSHSYGSIEYGGQNGSFIPVVIKKIRKGITVLTTKLRKIPLTNKLNKTIVNS